jgi:hypothetical protein
VIHLDEQSSWPGSISLFVERWTSKLAGSTEFASDLSSSLLEQEDEFRRLLTGNKLMAYHCTRLLDAEVPLIRGQGLCALSPQLVETKLRLAEEEGALESSTQETLVSGNVFAIDNAAGRANKICFVAGRNALDRHADGLSPLLGGWGGEAMNGWARPDQNPILSSIGCPAIIAASIDVNSGDHTAMVFPGLAKAFVGVALGLADAGCEIHLFTDVPGSDVVDIWQPGHPEYDRHALLSPS